MLKNNLIDIFLGDFDYETQPTNKLTFPDPIPVTNYLLNAVHSQYGENVTFEILKSLNAKDSAGDEKNVLVNVCLASNGQYFIAILDALLKVQAILDHYSNGDIIQKIEAINVSENGEFFMVTTDNGARQFIMLNNFTVPIDEQYSISKREEINLSGQIANSTEVIEIYKSPNSATYFFFGEQVVDSNTVYQRYATLKVNTGDQNEWVDYVNQDSSSANTRYRFKNAVVDWTDDESPKFRTLLYLGDQNSGRLMYTTNNGTNYNASTFPNGIGLLLGTSYSLQMVMNNINECYIAHIRSYTSSNEDRTYIRIAHYNFLTNTSNQYELEDTNSLDTNLDSFIRILKCNNDMFFASKFQVDNKLPVYRIGKLNESGNYNNEIFPLEGSLLTGEAVFIFKEYNLYRIIFQSFSHNNNEVEFSYNINDYNGTAYKNYNSFFSKKCQLYNGGHIIYARNIYNKSIFDKSMTASFEIPFQILNDILVEEQSLIGETNQLIVSNNLEFEKNIYENIILNFIIAINVIFENTVIDSAANKLCSCLFENGTLLQEQLYVKIIKNNSSQKMKLKNISTKINDTKISYSFNFYQDGNVSKIQIVNNDESNIYGEIVPTNKVGFFYVTQELEVV